MKALPNWERWLACESVSLDEAAALTLNLSPDWVRTVTVTDKSLPTREEYAAAMDALLRVQRGEAAPSAPAVPAGRINWTHPAHTNEDGRARLQVLRECFDGGSPLLPPVPTPDKPGHRPERRVRLVDVARFGRSQGWTMPQPLASIGDAEGADSVPTPGQAHPGDEVKLKVLKAELGARWPTMLSDLDDAATNGLASARVRHGWYSRAGVLAWLAARGKLEPESALSGLAVMRHRPR